VPGDWERERDRAVSSFNRIAEQYCASFDDKLDRKSFDKDFVSRMAGLTPHGMPILEVGAGPGQVSRYLRAHGKSVIMSDASESQVRHASRRLPDVPALVADLRVLPFRDDALGGVAAYYCLMYGEVAHLEQVFAEWFRVLCPGGIALIVVHAGSGSIHATEWHGKEIDIELVMRDPDSVEKHVRSAGLDVFSSLVRKPLGEEHPTPRLFVLAGKNMQRPEGDIRNAKN
jgi:uncharacterized protein